MSTLILYPQQGKARKFLSQVHLGLMKFLKQVRQQDAYLAIRPAYPRGVLSTAAKSIKKLHTLLVSLYF